MQTLLTESPDVAAQYILSGRLAAFPTETVYGLGADALNVDAVRSIYAVKGRPDDNPLIVHLASASMIPVVSEQLTSAAVRLIEHFFPGPLTIVAEKAPGIPAAVTAGLSTVAFRVPSHPVASAFLRACDRPVAAPSANRSGRPSPTTWEAVMEDFRGLIPCILNGGRSEVGLESSVVDCTGETPLLLRQGAVSLDELRTVAGVEWRPTENAHRTRSPGLRHRHYAPMARVVIADPTTVSDAPDAAFIGLDAPDNPSGFAHVCICKSVEEYAHELYHFFRECDRRGVSVIFCGPVSRHGIGTALTDRLERASRG